MTACLLTGVAHLNLFNIFYQILRVNVLKETKNLKNFGVEVLVKC